MGGSQELVDTGPPSSSTVYIEREDEPNLLGGGSIAQPSGTPGIGIMPRVGTSPVGRRVTHYFEYDQWSLFGSKSPEYILSVQNGMVAAGLVDASDLTPGYWSAESASAMKQLLTEANAMGQNWETALTSRIQFASLMPDSGGGGGRTFVAPTYLAPDYATISQAAKKTFEQIVGRPPKDYELALMADQLAADSRSEYNAQVAASRAEFSAAAPDEANHSVDRYVGGATVQGVDPMARLMESIQSRYSGEIEAESDEVDFATNTALLSRNLAGLTGMQG